MLVYFAASLVMLLGFCGLALDVARMELRKTQLQVAADGAALSVAAEYQRGNSSWAATATTEATLSAAANGYPTPTIAVQQFAGSGAYATDNSTFQVTLTQTVSTTFLKILGKTSSTVVAQGVAMVPPCIFLLGPGYPSRSGADLALSSSQMNNLPCPTYAKDGFVVDGFSHICCTTPKTNSAGSGVNGGGWTYPAIQYSSPAIADPLAYVASPSFTACTPGLTGKNYTSSTTISPGTYCGGLKATGGGVVLTMQPGLYIITGGVTFTGVSGNQLVVNGTGVTLYLTKGGGSSYNNFNATNVNLNISAPTDNSGTGGCCAAISVFGDRAWTGTSTDFNIVFSPWYGDGIIYLTNTGIYNWTSNMSGPHYFTIVAANLAPQAANIQPSTNYSLLPGGDPLHLPITLVQ